MATSGAGVSEDDENETITNSTRATCNAAEMKVLGPMSGGAPRQG